MSYRVLIQPPAAADLDEAYRWIAERSPANAARRLDQIQAAIQTLASFRIVVLQHPRMMRSGKRSGSSFMASIGFCSPSMALR